MDRGLKKLIPFLKTFYQVYKFPGKRANPDNQTDFEEKALKGRISKEKVLKTGKLKTPNINSEFLQDAASVCSRILDLESRIDDSLEIEALLHGFEGGYIPAGPSGLIMRGEMTCCQHKRILFFDPKRIPTKAAWRVGQQLSGC